MTQVISAINEYNNKTLNIIRIQNNLNDVKNNVIVNVIYCDVIIAEISIQMGPRPVAHTAHKFLNEL